MTDIQGNEEIGDEDRHYTKEEELLWSSLWEEGYDADKKNLIKTFRTLITTKDQACREAVEEVNRSWREDPMTQEHHAQIVANAIEKERERILKILDEMEDHTARNVVLYHLTLPTKDSI